MLFTLSTTHQPATDLGFLLHKHPDRLHEISLPQGKALMFYPEATQERCTFALTLELDPVQLVRGSGQKGDAGLLDEYVNDRPYAVSSFLTVALGRALGTAFTGRSKDRQVLAETPIPLEVTLTPLPVRGAEDLPERLFKPLGYEVQIERHPLLAAQSTWGESPYITLTLTTTQRLQTVLEHLFVLIPVLDNRKHYYIGKAELEKLLRKGEAWLQQHPEKRLITERYLKYRKVLVQEALVRLADEAAIELEASSDCDLKQNLAEFELEKPLNLNELRLATVTQVLLEHGAERVLDLGCGEGRLLKSLLQQGQFNRIVGVDVSLRALEIAERRLHLDTLSEKQRERIELWQGALTYRDQRFAGFNALVLVEVIEHLEPDRLDALERVVFEFAHPELIVITTPNREFNARFPNLANGKLRHADHRFEWTRAEFQAWCERVATTYGYQVALSGIGETDPELGSVTQIGVFTL
ncbi:MAG: 3' terminal RNA ribose 2'-O-methyltransferase Hen1 [Thiothrix sp.]|nr:MAG: 3' terminal RNA ribose 2'-O-methyltransferase Hen1 [Thiothrix sp.]